MFLDVATIYIKAGNGGDGAVSWHREKYVPDGGPDGGDGGAGGDIVFEGDPGMTSLSPFRFTQHFRAENGEKGSGKNCTGRSGEDLVIKVPCGTVVKDSETGGILADIFEAGERVTILKGGRGGRGNAKFATALRRAPGFSETGEKTVERKIKLELKTIADVGLVGFPNVGKSTILSVVSAARPKIANYHFTTLNPNLGVVRYFDDSFIMADIPGLIEGAADGAGLGHSFLRHIERVRLIVHVVDISGSEGRDPAEDYFAIRTELEKYSKSLAGLPEIVAANKSDITPDTKDRVKAFSEKIGKPVITVSAATKSGLNELLFAINETLKTLPPKKRLEYRKFEYKERDKNSFSVHVEDGSYVVTGGYVEELSRRVVLSDPESFRWFQRALRDKGVIAELKKAGIKDGDTVSILDIDFEYWE